MFIFFVITNNLIADGNDIENSLVSNTYYIHIFHTIEHSQITDALFLGFFFFRRKNARV